MTGLMSKIQPLIFNPAESPGNASFGYHFARVVPRQVPEPRQLPLNFSQVLFALSKQPRISNLLTVRKIGKVFKANIYTDYRARVFGLLELVLNRKANKLVQSIPANSAGLHFTHDLTVKVHSDSSDFGNGKFIVLPNRATSCDRPTALGIGETFVTVTVLEAWETSFLTQFSPAKEALKSFINPFENILQDLGMDFFKFSSFFFNLRKLIRLVVIVEGPANHPVSIPAFLQSSVVEFTAKPESNFKFSFLSFGREYSKLVGFASFHLDCNRSNSALRIRSKASYIFSPVIAAIIRSKRKASGDILDVINSFIGVIIHHVEQVVKYNWFACLLRKKGMPYIPRHLG